MLQRFFHVLAIIVALPAVVATVPARAADCDNGDCSAKQYHRPAHVYRHALEHRVDRAPSIKMTTPAYHQPMHFHVVHTPPVYGTVTRHIEVVPARAHYVTTPAVTKIVTREVMVAAEAHHGHHRGHHHVHGIVHRNGRDCGCEHDTRPHMRVIRQQVIVQTSHRVLRYTPAVYKTVEQPVLLRPASRHVLAPALPSGGHYGFIHRDHDRATWHWHGHRRP